MRDQELIPVGRVPSSADDTLLSFQYLYFDPDMPDAGEVIAMSISLVQCDGIPRILLDDGGRVAGAVYAGLDHRSNVVVHWYAATLKDGLGVKGP